MDYIFTFKKNPPNKSLMKLTKKKLQKIIEKYSRKSLDAHITIIKEGNDYNTFCHFKAGSGLSCEVSATSQDLHSSIDILLGKLETSLKRKKEKLKGHHHKLHQKFADKNIVNNKSKSIFDRDWDMIPIDAEDVIKFEKARTKKYG
jgi:ribosomal subunit interface protein